MNRPRPPSNPKEVQVLTEMLAALNRFISKFADRCQSFYQLLKKWKGFHWDEGCDEAFRELKEYLARVPRLTAPEPGEDLFMYLSVTDHAVSSVLLRDQGVQMPVYYISKTLVDAETRYLPLEKLVLALVHATRKLPHYFQAHMVFVLTEYPLQSLLKRSDFTGRIAKWGTQLGSFDIRYRPRSSVKGQVLADFIVEFTPKNDGKVVCNAEIRLLKVFVDGASNAMGVGAGIVIITPEGIPLEHSFRLGFKASNNEAEYEALLAGLRAILHLGAKDVEIYSDSRLVGRSQNKHADSLATLASSATEDTPWLVTIELIREPSISVKSVHDQARVEVAKVAVAKPCWMNPIIDFLAEDKVPNDEDEAKKIHRVAPQYWLSSDHKLYQRSFAGPYLLCLHPEKVSELLTELHEGVCGGHVGGRSLAHRAMT
ncbi:uncharacterized protein LOC126721668 [Quercus robur]|uniref:uncharacterized protein LOC126721668 n=1 Tax=Quercus robur TaxID=38942 RepID=UPI002161E4A4|nr:uncharacterized protein LOC126721668 [Quercus robur]